MREVGLILRFSLIFPSVWHFLLYSFIPHLGLPSIDQLGVKLTDSEFDWLYQQQNLTDFQNRLTDLNESQKLTISIIRKSHNSTRMYVSLSICNVSLWLSKIDWWNIMEEITWTLNTDWVNWSFAVTKLVTELVLFTSTCRPFIFLKHLIELWTLLMI